MKIYNDANILNLIEQIREVNHLIELHNLSNDDFMLTQYKARKNDFLKELVLELMLLDINTYEIFKLVKSLINKIETSAIYQTLNFSICELESVTN